MWQTPKTCSPSLVAGPRLTFSFSAAATFFGAMAGRLQAERISLQARRQAPWQKGCRESTNSDTKHLAQEQM